MKNEVKKTLKKIGYYSPFIFVGLLLMMNSVSLLYPVVWGLTNSFKDVFEYTLNPNGLPETWNFDNWSYIFTKLKIQRMTENGIQYLGIKEMFVNTVVWSVWQPLLPILFTMIMGYVIAIYVNPLTKFLYQLGIVLMCLVVVGTFPAQMTLYKDFGIYDNMFMMILIQPQGCFSGFTFLLFYNLFKAVPKEFSEAAQIDGAGQFRVMCTVYFPHVITTGLVYYIMGIMGAWNDYATFLIWLPSYANLSYGMYIFQYDATILGATMPQVLAGFFIVAIPSAILYICLDKQLVSKLQVTGLK